MSALVSVSLGADADLRRVAVALAEYLERHPQATADLYRRGKYQVRARVVDPQFTGLTVGQRQRAVWGYLGQLPEEVASEVSFLVAITPDELTGGANAEFENPTPISQLPELFYDDARPLSVRDVLAAGVPNAP